MAMTPPTNEPTRLAPNLERDIREVAPRRPEVVSMPRTEVGPQITGEPTASTVSKRLEVLIKGCSDLRKQAEILAVAMTGTVPSDGTQPGPGRVAAGQSLFAKQMQALDELALLLDSVRGSIERANRSLA